MPNNFILTQDQIASIEDRLNTVEARSNASSGVFQTKDGKGKTKDTSLCFVPNPTNDTVKGIKIWAARITLTIGGTKKTTWTSGNISTDGINLKTSSISVTLSVPNDKKEPLMPVVIRTGDSTFKIKVCSLNPPGGKGNQIQSQDVIANIIAIGY